VIVGSKLTRQDAGKAVAATLAAPLVALGVSAALMAALPLRQELAFAIGLHLFIPLWVSLACVLPLARSGRWAWGACSAALALALLVLIVRGSR
jgi:hypothetical protein